MISGIFWGRGKSMNYSIVRHVVAWVIFFAGIFMLLPFLVGVYYKETAAWAYLITGAFCIGIGLIVKAKPVKNKVFYAKEGFVATALCWICFGLAGAVPFVLSGEIPFYIDALFESVSGFTTTGASILNNVEALSHASLFWRSLLNWIGGMGILIFVMAVMPLAGSYNMHLMRAESPGPSVGKLLPKVKQTALMLYSMYIVLTAMQIVLLRIFGLTNFQSVTTSFSTAATGGFGILNDSVASFTPAVQNIITVFMILFAVNFNVFFLLIMRKVKLAVKNEEVRYYFIIYGSVVALITINTLHCFGSVRAAIHHSAFTVASIMSTTGFSTVDYGTWPMFSQILLVMFMFIGGCAGSTGGGMKVSRIILLLKVAKNEMSYLIHPRRVRQIRLNGQPVNKETVRSVQAYLLVYICIGVVSILLVALDEFDVGTTFSSVVTALNNVGPGIGLVGPSGNFSIFSPLSKIVLILDMLAGRLELFPLVMLSWPGTWREWK